MLTNTLIRTASAAPPVPPTLEYVNTYAPSSITGAAVTYTNVGIGTASADRLVIGVLTSYIGNGNHIYTAVTIGGTAGTEHLGFDQSTTVHACMCSRVISSGTTASFVFSSSGFWFGTKYSRLSVYTLKNYNSATPTFTNTGTGTQTRTVSATTVADSCGVAGIVSGSAANSVTFSGLDEDVDIEISNTPVHGAASKNGLTSPSTSITATLDVSSFIRMVVAVWR